MQSQILPVQFSMFQPGGPDPASLLESHDVWSSEHLQDFAERMATHGMAISCVRLRNDAGYTLRQVAKAQVMDDEVLRKMAVTLLRQFEEDRSGLAAPLSDGSHP